MDPEVKKLEKTLTKEQKGDASLLSHAEKAVRNAEKADTKAQKDVYKAESTAGKAMKEELKTAKKMNEATHDHEVAVTGQRKADQDVQLKQQHNQRLQADLTQKKAELEQVQRKKVTGDIARNERRSQVRKTSAGSSESA
ncbi:hypothetical protein EWM64_g2538 [Hericium alpestre]|uniref:Uncharacterized protein n=1 Tax=Hericium alpestre TaxID=135208 RepID=A0A4Z0A377_9AGAM|nr:hypothetical protein EWM64_g2538 [Hericium alpestre]